MNYQPLLITRGFVEFQHLFAEIQRRCVNLKLSGEAVGVREIPVWVMRRIRRPRVPEQSMGGNLHLRLQVILQTNFVNQTQLFFQEVSMIFFGI
jgi:hypothetical protein